MSPDEIRSHQEKTISSLVARASIDVPHYRKTLKDVSVKSIDDLGKIPILTKKDIQADPESFMSSAYPRRTLSPHRTSGSSGYPLTVLYSKEDAVQAEALRCHWLMENGVSPLESSAEIMYYSYPPNILQRAGIFRRTYLSLKETEKNNLKGLMSMRPSTLISIPSVLVPLALENQRSKTGFSVKRVFSFAETLSENARDLIASSFGCTISDRYGCIETGPIAWECPHGGMHVYSDSMIVEIVDDHGAPVHEGEYGEVVLTSLSKRCMPFIRYAIGDRACWGRCRCGRGWPAIAGLAGRSNAGLILPSGRVFPSTMIGAVLRKIPGILQFQSIQTPDGLRILLVQKDHDTPAKAEVMRAVNAIIPEPLGIEIESVDRIKGEAGKICDFISLSAAGANPQICHAKAKNR